MVSNMGNKEKPSKTGKRATAASSTERVVVKKLDRNDRKLRDKNERKAKNRDIRRKARV